jgi:hypothetical protein
MDHRTAYGLDRINKIYRIENQDAGLSFCIRPASTPIFTLFENIQQFSR